ncbi:hypothetical protein [Sphingomonas sp.]|uniref:hypothetical protein n=1 Tax=Sphingomonas sp. TaxID=28214 RepID=UPI00257B10E4|nr:hypothetical protein [Sphingomonas sp.]
MTILTAAIRQSIKTTGAALIEANLANPEDFVGHRMVRHWATNMRRELGNYAQTTVAVVDDADGATIGEVTAPRLEAIRKADRIGIASGRACRLTINGKPIGMRIAEGYVLEATPADLLAASRAHDA